VAISSSQALSASAISASVGEKKASDWAGIGSLCVSALGVNELLLGFVFFFASGSSGSALPILVIS